MSPSKSISIVLEPLKAKRHAVITALSEVLCDAVGGIGNTTSGSPGNGSSAGNGSVAGGGNTPTPKTFTGGAAGLMSREVGWLGLALVGLMGMILVG